MSDFIYPVQLVCSDDTLYFKQFTHRQSKNFVKVILNGNTHILEMFINTAIRDLCISDINPESLSCLDKLCILLNIRAYNMSPVAKFNTVVEGGRQEELVIDVNDIIAKLRQYNIRHSFSLDKDGVQIQGTIPKMIAAESQIDVITSSVDTITFNGKVIDLNTLEFDQRKHVIDRLPSFVLSSIVSFLYEQEIAMKKVPLISLGPGQELHLSFVDGSIAEIIKLFFNTDLRHFYQTEYTLIKHFNFSHESINNCAPAELLLYYNIINEELKQQKEAEQKQAGPAPPGAPNNLKS